MIKLVYGEIITLDDGEKYKVHTDFLGGLYINNDNIFDFYNIGNKTTYVNQILGANKRYYAGIFPQVGDLTNLTILVAHLSPKTQYYRLQKSKTLKRI